MSPPAMQRRWNRIRAPPRGRSVTRAHWSDCAVNRAPACEPGPCDCGGLDLAAYDRYVLITSLIPTPRSLARFIEDGVLPSAVEAEKAPRIGIAALASAPDLPSAHDGVAVIRGPDSMDLNNAAEPPVGDTKSLPGVQSITGNVPPHNDSPQNKGGDGSKGDAK